MAGMGLCWLLVDCMHAPRFVVAALAMSYVVIVDAMQSLLCILRCVGGCCCFVGAPVHLATLHFRCQSRVDSRFLFCRACVD